MELAVLFFEMWSNGCGWQTEIQTSDTE